MEIIRYVEGEAIRRLKERMMNISELISSSNYERDCTRDIPIKIIIPEDNK